jgi:hypothetical protein
VGRRADALREQMLFIEMFTLSRAWTDLTDDEFFWDPMPGSWGIHPVEESRTPTPFVIGDWAADMDSDLASDPDRFEPLTTIGWLFWHCGTMAGRTTELDFLGGEHTTDSGWTSPYLADHPIFTTAEDAVSTMREGWRALDAALRAATDERLEQPIQFWGYGGPGPEGTGAQVVASVLNEISHHGTQIGVLRDLYRLRGGTPIERLVD